MLSNESDTTRRPTISTSPWTPHLNNTSSYSHWTQKVQMFITKLTFIILIRYIKEYRFMNRYKRCYLQLWQFLEYIQSKFWKYFQFLTSFNCEVSCSWPCDFDNFAALFPVAINFFPSCMRYRFPLLFVLLASYHSDDSNIFVVNDFS